MNRRQWHVYIGCFFAPLLIYFCLSGAWQVFRLNDLPKTEEPSAIRRVLHNLSMPHTSALLPGADRKKSTPSLPFKLLSVTMALGFVLTALLGVQMGFQAKARRRAVIWCLVAGAVLPILFLLAMGPARSAPDAPGASLTSGTAAGDARNK